jgi:hypothetical protein
VLRDRQDAARLADDLRVLLMADFDDASMFARRALDGRRRVPAALADEMHHLRAVQLPAFAVRVRMLARPRQ